MLSAESLNLKKRKPRMRDFIMKKVRCWPSLFRLVWKNRNYTRLFSIMYLSWTRFSRVCILFLLSILLNTWRSYRGKDCSMSLFNFPCLYPLIMHFRQFLLINSGFFLSTKRYWVKGKYKRLLLFLVYYTLKYIQHTIL